MKAESMLYAVLAAHSGLAALVADRIWPDAIPEESSYPAVVYTRQLTDPIVTIDGGKHGEFVTLRISAWSASRTASDAVADQIEAALATIREHATAREAGFDADVALFATHLECTLLGT